MRTWCQRLWHKLVSLDWKSAGPRCRESWVRANSTSYCQHSRTDSAAVRRIESVVQSLHTKHELVLGDARQLDGLTPKTVHLVVTSPPYWTLKRYNESAAQLGHVADYEAFLDSLDQVWRHCFRRCPGGRLVCVVGDVCLSRRQNNGRHTVVPLHAAIQERCRGIGFDNLAPIIWHKIANANYEVPGNSAGFLGKPYEPNAVIKNDVEFIVMQRKPGGYRSPSKVKRVLSLISAENYQLWFRQIWSDITGASTRNTQLRSRLNSRKRSSECSALSAIPCSIRSWGRGRRIWPRHNGVVTA